MLIHPAEHLPPPPPPTPRPPKPPAVPRRPFQFRLRHLFLLVFLAAGMLSGMRYGVWFVLSFVVPLGLLAFSLGPGRANPLHTRRWWLALPTLILSATVPCLFRLMDGQSVCLLLGWALWGLWFAVRFEDARGWLGQFVPAGLAAGCLAFPSVTSSDWETLGVFRLEDGCGRRRGVDFLGVGLDWPGPDSAAIERYAGRIPPIWFDASSWDDDGDGGLAKRLALLPHDEARRAVAKALSDPWRQVAWHQEQSLRALERQGYPPGTSPESWWREHSALYQSAIDDEHALAIVRGLRALDVTTKDDLPTYLRGYDDIEDLLPQRSRFTRRDRWAIEYLVHFVW